MSVAATQNAILLTIAFYWPSFVLICFGDLRERKNRWAIVTFFWVFCLGYEPFAFAGLLLALVLSYRLFLINILYSLVLFVSLMWLGCLFFIYRLSNMTIWRPGMSPITDYVDNLSPAFFFNSFLVALYALLFVLFTSLYLHSRKTYIAVIVGFGLIVLYNLYLLIAVPELPTTFFTFWNIRQLVLPLTLLFSGWYVLLRRQREHQKVSTNYSLQLKIVISLVLSFLLTRDFLLTKNWAENRVAVAEFVHRHPGCNVIDPYTFRKNIGSKYGMHDYWFPLLAGQIERGEPIQSLWLIRENPKESDCRPSQEQTQDQELVYYEDSYDGAEGFSLSLADDSPIKIAPEVWQQTAIHTEASLRE